MTQQIDRREFIRRGAAAGVLATTGLPAAALAIPAAAAAATEPALAGLEDRRLDSRDFCLSVYDTITPSLTFTATNERDARRWQRTARQRVLERIGGLPTTRVPLLTGRGAA